MNEPATPVFAFDERDHLTRIHLKLALEDVGFAVIEDETTIRIEAPCDTATIPCLLPLASG